MSGGADVSERHAEQLDGVPTRRLVQVLPLALATIVFGTAVPIELRTQGEWSLSFHSGDFLINVLLYVPLGLSWSKHPLWRGMAMGATLSITIEVLQLWYFGRQAALFDILANSLGLVCGVCAGRLLRRTGRRPTAVPLDARAAATATGAVLLLMLAWLWPAAPSTLANWDESFNLLLGNEATSDRPWRGELAALALVPQSLSRAQLRESSNLFNDEVRADLFRRGAYLLPESVRLDGLAAQRLPSAAENRFFEQAVQRNGFTVIAVMAVADLRQGGPARVITYSRDQFQRNFDLGQEGRRLVFRVRTPATGLNGMDPYTQTPPVLEAGRPLTVTATFDGVVARLQVDGQSLGRQHLASAGCAVPSMCESDLPLAASLFGMLLAVIALAAGRPQSHARVVMLTIVVGAAGAALMRLLEVDRGSYLFGWGAPLLVLAGAVCVWTVPSRAHP